MDIRLSCRAICLLCRFVRRARAGRLSAALAFGLATAVAGVVPESRDVDAFALMSLEELARIPVVTVSKRAEPAWNAAAALSLVTNDEIRRSGARTLGAALRLAPGLSVAQVNARDWMVGARGFDQQFANKLLVMLDGRSLYTSWFGGVFWDEHDLMLEDLAQIEVVRGPGAAVWGANAVNGVINLVTKPAAETTGLLMTSTVGTTETSGAVRYGARAGEGWAWRVYARAFRHDESLTEAGAKAGDGWAGRRAGFRLDRTSPDGPRFSLSGEAYRSRGDFFREGVRFAPPNYTFVDRESGVRLSGGHVLARWDNLGTDGEGIAITASADTNWRLQSAFEVEQDAGEVSVQQIGSRGRHLWSWGGGVRATRDRSKERNGIAFVPADDSTRVLSVFAQDQIAFLDDRLQLIAGARFEDSDYVDGEIQPNLRLMWRPHGKAMGWAAVSRAIRSPTRTETGLRFDAAVLPPGALGPNSFPAIVRWTGRPDHRREVLTAYEAGVRLRPSERISFELSVFAHEYRDLTDIGPVGLPIVTTSSGVFFALANWTYRNSLEGSSRGAEAVFTFQPDARQRWQAGLTVVRMALSGPSDGTDKAYFEGSTPDYEAFLRGTFALSRTLEASLGARAVGERPSLGIPAYASLDLRVGWRVRPDLQVELLAENVADPAHPEFREGLGNLVNQVRRGVFLRVTWER
jgi:iron complex outermembrane receptor protein